MGQLRTRKRGKTWEYSFEGAPVDGKRTTISKGGFRTKEECIKAGTAAKSEYDNCGRVFIPSEISVSDYLDYWIKSYVTGLSPRTYEDYQSKIKNHIKPAFGMYKLSSLAPDIIQDWVNSKKNTGLSKGMIKNLLACLSGAMNYAVLPCKYIKFNPCNGVRIPKMPTDINQKKKNEYVLSKEEFERIIIRFENTVFYLPLEVGYHLGTRIGETYGIDLLHDPDFDSGKITINHQLQKLKGSPILDLPKYESVRTIRMDKILAELLQKEIHKRKLNMLRYGSYYLKTYITPENKILQATPDANIALPEIMPLSVRENGELMTPDSFKYCARVIHYELNNPLFHYHSLRHTHGTILAEGGASPKTVMERLGHKDIRVTMNTYIFNTDKMESDSIGIFENYLAG